MTQECGFVIYQRHVEFAFRPFLVIMFNKKVKIVRCGGHPAPVSSDEMFENFAIEVGFIVSGSDEHSPLVLPLIAGR